jgi:YVTN family beta-propeller protein
MLALALAVALLPAPHVTGPRSTADATPTYRFTARGAHGFRCAIDARPFAACQSPWTPRLTVGAHVLRVRALDARRRPGRTTTLNVRVLAPGPRARQAVTVEGSPWGMLLAQDSLWVASFNADVVLRLDPVTGATRARIPLGGDGTTLAENGSAVWAATFDKSRIVRVDSGAATSPITVGPGPEHLVSGFGALWTANKGCLDPSNPCPGNGSVSRVDPATGTVQTIPVGKEPRYVAAGSSSVWATSFYSDTLTRIDPATAAIAAVVAAPKGPSGIAEAFGSVWVAGGSEVWRYDPATLTVTAKIALPRGAETEDLKASADAIWTANSGAGSVSRIDPATNRVTTTVQVGLGPRQLAIGPGYLWVSNLNGGSVQRVDF